MGIVYERFLENSLSPLFVFPMRKQKESAFCEMGIFKHLVHGILLHQLKGSRMLPNGDTTQKTRSPLYSSIKGNNRMIQELKNQVLVILPLCCFTTQFFIFLKSRFHSFSKGSTGGIWHRL